MRGVSRQSRSSLVRATSPIVEALERRQLLSVSLNNGVLVITGTEGNDNFILSGNGGNIVVNDNGTLRQYAQSSVSAIQVSLLGGDDRLVIDATHGAIAAPRTIDAGEGNDTVNGSAGVDIVFGQGGNDSLRGGGGDDRLVGGAGSDTLKAGVGNDTLVGNGGSDWANGQGGNDLVKGGPGGDYLYGGGGNDTLRAGGGSDVLGGDIENRFRLAGDPALPVVNGIDEYIAGGGDDTILSHGGADTITGGDGRDVFDVRGPGSVLTDQQTSGDFVESNYWNVGVNGAIVETKTIHLRILINGQQVQIPQGAGQNASGQSATIATDGNGTIVYRTSIPGGLDFATLGAFFLRWGVSFDANHIGRSVANANMEVGFVVNGDGNAQFENYVIQNSDEIVINYAHRPVPA